METKRPMAVGQLETSWSAMLLLAGVMIGSHQLPWALLAGIPALGALALSIRAVWLRLRAKESVGAMWSSIGVLFAGYLLLAVGVQAVLYEPIDTYRRCSAAANTAVADQACQDAMRSHLGGFGAGLVGAP